VKHHVRGGRATSAKGGTTIVVKIAPKTMKRMVKRLRSACGRRLSLEPTSADRNLFETWPGGLVSKESILDRRAAWVMASRKWQDALMVVSRLMKKAQKMTWKINKQLLDHDMSQSPS
jgi:hypothetical protein